MRTIITLVASIAILGASPAPADAKWFKKVVKMVTAPMEKQQRAMWRRRDVTFCCGALSCYFGLIVKVPDTGLQALRRNGTFIETKRRFLLREWQQYPGWLVLGPRRMRKMMMGYDVRRACKELTEGGTVLDCIADRGQVPEIDVSDLDAARASGGKIAESASKEVERVAESVRKEVESIRKEVERAAESIGSPPTTRPRSPSPNAASVAGTCRTK